MCNIYNSSSGNMAVQHPVAIVLCAAVVLTLGLGGTSPVWDIDEIRHVRVAVASEDTITQQLQVKFVK